MSFDIDVYGRLSPSIREVISLVPDALTTQSGVGDDLVAGIFHRESGEYCFTLEGPYSIDDLAPEERRTDLPEAMKCRYSITVEGTDAGHVAHALRFAEHLAVCVDGRHIDLQAEPSSAALPETSLPISDTSFLHVEWHRRFDADSRSLAAHYVESAENFLPRALPVAYGNSEPLKRKYATDGKRGVDQMYRAQCGRDRLVIRGQKPLLSGFIDAWSDEYVEEFHYIRLVFDAAALAKPRFRTAFEEFFIDLARSTNSFFAFAEVNQSRHASSLALSQRGEWPGLPTRAPWLSWFSSDYAALVRPHLSAGDSKETEQGLLYRLPSELSQQGAQQGEQAPWLPQEFLPTRGNPSRKRQSTATAKTMPSFLRSPSSLVRVG